MKAVLRSIKPYWVFLIIAQKMGWNILEEKTVEVGKDQPRAEDWNRRTLIYCSKDRKSFNSIPKEYQPLMRPLLGKVIGEFVCDKIDIVDVPYPAWSKDYLSEIFKKSCLTYKNLHSYIGSGNTGYVWHISDLKIYDKQKEIWEFKKTSKCPETIDCSICKYWNSWAQVCAENLRLTRPPQSWCYVE